MEQLMTEEGRQGIGIGTEAVKETVAETVAEIKQAAADYPIHPLLRARWSPRAFADTPVEAAKLRSLLEAARWAASGGNGQPWHFIVATRTEPEQYAKLAACLNPGNAEWATSAPVLMLTVAKMTTSSGRPHRHAFHDVGLAVQNLSIQATALDLYVHQMAGFSVEDARLLYGIPDGYEPVTMLAIGYLGDPETLPEARRQQELSPRSRKALGEFVFEETWGRPAALVS
jgi:nitroreductase